MLNKPYDVLSQFTREVPSHRTLADVYDFPPGVYPVGRLDRDSEGLLLLTDDKRLNQKLLDPSNGHSRTYHVQVDGEVGQAALDALAAGPEIRVGGKVHRSKPVQVRIIAPAVAPRVPPIRVRKHIPTTWLELVLTEGKNRQVRRMCAAVGHPVLRLIRYAIGGVTLDMLEGARAREVDWTWLQQQRLLK
ncbi:Ribosomal large subunit pseudouridine synthase E [Neolewinella maritima]|uniref:Pseudouridine synthase n=1 Tax=Neolewinella maritima TaxID=1383882 RepID=A0ABN8F688_9BACT|nr:pseudouridine synthase [Neolewinella maritima]CAH1000448.1 Ribosomal large subunit pseudouridine synthase E [Neolewinella maritima]